MTYRSGTPLKRRQRLQRPGALRHLDLHRRLGVGEAGGGAEQDRRGELLAQVKGQAGKLPGFLAIRRLQAGELTEAGVLAVILLVLRGETAGVVGGDQHQSGPDAGVGDGHQTVGGDVDADVFHRRQRAGAAEGGANGRVQRDLLVAGPFRHHARILGQVLQDFGGRGARVGRGVADAGLPCPQRDGLISRKYPFHRSPCIPDVGGAAAGVSQFCHLCNWKKPQRAQRAQR
jgi:hypothetical protein